MRQRLSRCWIMAPLLITALAVLVVACQAPTPTRSTAPEGAAKGPTAPKGAATAPTLSTEDEGARLYATFCAACHGLDGKTVPGVVNAPSLNNPALLSLLDDDRLRQTIAEGRPGANGLDRPGTKMAIFGAAHGGPLEAEQIEAIVAHVAKWRTESLVEIDEYRANGHPANGAQVYATHCATCHGADGWGTDAPRLAGQTLQRTYSDGMMRHVIRNGRPGTAMVAIPLGDRDVADVIAFVRTLGHPASTP